MAAELDQLCIDTVRFLSVDAVQKANSGHPGMPLGAAPMAYALWTRLLKHNPRNPDWLDRDRFVLSAGHGSMLLYSLLHLTGYDLSLDDIKHFRQWGSKAPGHPERGHTPGVEVTTGPLGQGFANAVGMAIAEAQLASRYNRPGFKVIDHATYAIVSDGDLMEGVAAEAASLAGHLRLGKLTCLYDNNYVSLAAGTDITLSEDRAGRFDAYGWHTVSVDDGNDLAAIDAALQAARAETARPSLILVRTHIGYGSPHKQDTFEAHGSPLGHDEVRLTKQNLGWPIEPEFLIPEPALAHFREALERGARDQAAWNERMSAYERAFPQVAQELWRSLRGELPPDWDAEIPFFPADATSDQPETFYVAEVVREQVFHFTHQEVPYAVAVRVEELTERARPERLDIRATVFVEQESQKGILIGKGGAMLKRIGTESRRELERFFGIQVFLGLRVDVRRNWRKDPQALREFGFRLTS